MKNKSTKDTILSTKSALMYSLGILGVQLIFGYVNSFHAEFVRISYQDIAPNVMYVAAAIILAAKIISCIADPIIGTLIDRSNLKGGKMRPFILYSAFPLAVLTVVMFIYIPFDNLGNAGKYVMYVYIAFMTALWNIAMSFADIPSGGMLSMLTPNRNERNKAAAISNTCKSIGLGIPGVMLTLVGLIVPSLKENKRVSYLAAAGVAVFLGTILYLLIYWCNRERVQSVQKKQVGFREMFVEIKQNKNMRIVFLTYMLGFGRNIPQAIMAQATGALIGGVITLPVLGTINDPSLNANWLIGLASAVVSAISLVIIPFVNKKLGEKKSAVWVAIISAIIGVTGFIVYVCLPNSAIRSGVAALGFIWLVQGLASVMTATHNYIPTIMTADIVDYQEWKTGERKDGVDYAILSVSHKLSTGMSMAAGIFLVALSGYGKEGISVTTMQNVVFLAFVGIPSICSLLSMIPMLFYKIDFKVKEQMRAELTEMRARRAQEAEDVAPVSDTQEV